MNYLTSILSPNMFNDNGLLKQTKISISELPKETESLLKQEWLAKLLSQKLGREINPSKKITILEKNDTLYVIQYFGPYLCPNEAWWPATAFDDKNFNCYRIEVLD